MIDTKIYPFSPRAIFQFAKQKAEATRRRFVTSNFGFGRFFARRLGL